LTDCAFLKGQKDIVALSVKRDSLARLHKHRPARRLWNREKNSML